MGGRGAGGGGAGGGGGGGKAESAAKKEYDAAYDNWQKTLNNYKKGSRDFDANRGAFKTRVGNRMDVQRNSAKLSKLTTKRDMAMDKLKAARAKYKQITGGK